MRATRTSLFFLGLFLLTLPAVGIVRVTLEIAGVEADASMPERVGVLRVTPVGGKGEGSPLDGFELKVSAPGSVGLPLKAGVIWRLEANIDGFWGPPRVITAAAADSPEQPVTLRLWPTGTVTGKLLVPRGEKLPEAITLRWQPTNTETDAVAPEASVPCPVGAEGAIRCALPVGRHDLRLRATGFVSHYFWDIDMARGKTVPMGDLALQRGASVAGRITTVDGPVAVGQCTLTLQPEMAAPLNSADLLRQHDRLTLKATANARGFFHFQGVPQGNYVLTARQKGFAPLEVRSLPVRANAETELQEVLVLAPPVTLRVAVEPAQDLAEKPWKVRVFRETAMPNVMEEVASGSTGDDGVFAARELKPGTYSIFIEDSQGARLAHKGADLGQTDLEMLFELPLVWVEGEITLGEEPLAAALFFGGEHGGERMEMASGEDGTFSGYVTREGMWRVDVVAEHPPVRRKLRDIEVQRRSGDRSAEVSIHLPDTRLDGVVVDDDDQPMPGVQVMAMEKDRVAFLSTRSGEGGAFTLRGVAEGDLTLQAEGPDATSDPVTVEVREASDPSLVRLRLRRRQDLTLRIVGRTGAMPGARIEAAPFRADGGSIPPILQETTGVQGEVRLSVPAQAVGLRLWIYPPGYPLTLATVTAREPRVQTITLEEDRGTLTLVTEEPFLWEEPLAPLPFVYLDGELVSGRQLQGWARLHGETNADRLRFTVPSMPVGQVIVCRAAVTAEMVFGTPPRPGPGCAQGFLPAGGELVLTLE
jgi:hypothetical protein